MGVKGQFVFFCCSLGAAKMCLTAASRGNSRFIFFLHSSETFCRKSLHFIMLVAKLQWFYHTCLTIYFCFKRLNIISSTTNRSMHSCTTLIDSVSPSFLCVVGGIVLQLLRHVTMLN